MALVTCFALALCSSCHAFTFTTTTTSTKAGTKSTSFTSSLSPFALIQQRSSGDNNHSSTALFRGNKKKRFDNDSLDAVMVPQTQTSDNNNKTGSNTKDNNKDKAVASGRRWAQHALLFSSFDEGMQDNPEALAYLKHGVVRKLCAEYSRWCQQQVKQSALASPCCGPTNLNALDSLEQCDALLKQYDQFEFSVDGQERDLIVDQILDLMTNFLVEENNEVTPQKEDGTTSSELSGTGTRTNKRSESRDDRLYNIFQLNVKLVYIPTAMYALRPDSNSTPGKQRQRARADGKSRRDVVFRTLEALFENQVDVLAVTLDLDDGSIKQPESTSDPGAINKDKRLFPQEGKEALTSWSPHIVYVEGGNTFWLSHCINLGDWDYYIQNACCCNTNAYDKNAAAAVYCGKSAGAIVGGSYVETATWKGWDDPSVVPGMEQPEDWKGIGGMNLLGDTNISFFPHMASDWSDTLQKRRASIKGKTAALEQQDVCLVDGKRQRYNVISASQSEDDEDDTEDDEDDLEPELTVADADTTATRQ
jgi:peptidase E